MFLQAAAEAITKRTFELALGEILKNRDAYRTVTVMYLLQCFYAEALLRADGTSPHEIPDIERDRSGEHYFLNVNIFGRYIRGKLLEKFNAFRGQPGLGGIDNCLGINRAGKRGGCEKDLVELLSGFETAQKWFVTKYLNGGGRETRVVDGASKSGD